MPRIPDLTPLPKHPAIIEGVIEFHRIYGHLGPCVQVVCPFCKEPRWYPMRTLRQRMKKEGSHFMGSCRRCYLSQPKARGFRLRGRNPSGRKVQSNGYVALGKNAVSDEDLDLFVTLRMKAGHVLEHRWVMSKHLGRPLISAECVDHMNGNKQDNRLENLRIYVRGKQQPGSCPGHGTYYHEWQMAERRIRELESRLATLSAR